MITYDLALRHGVIRSLTGLDASDFASLFADFEAAHVLRRREAHPHRQRAVGAGRPASCSLQTQLLMTLLWLRVYPTFALLGFFFGLAESSAWRTVQEVLLTLEGLSQFAFEKPAKERRALRTVAAVMDAFPDVALVIDAKEQRIRRPTSDKDNNVQKPYYSGKKKAHTLKSQIAVRPDGTIGALSQSVPGGANHDLTLLRESKLLDNLVEGEASMMDKGYDGIAKDYPQKILYLPHKARRNHPLTDAQKAYNAHLSSYRIVVEHTNAQLNQYQALSQVWRNQRERHTRVVRVVGGLVNRRLAKVPLRTYPAAQTVTAMATLMASAGGTASSA